MLAKNEFIGNNSFLVYSRNRTFKADELRQHVVQTHCKSWCGVGVKLFLHQLYPSPLTGDKQPISKQGQKKKRKRKNTASLD